MGNTRATGETENLSPLKQAILELREMRSKLETVERANAEPIAIIGMGLRFPGGATDAASYWRLLHESIDAVAEVPADRWDINAYFDPEPNAPGKMTTKYGAFIQDIDQFDPHFFGISPREAASMDPQQRLLLEVAWEALENASQAPERLMDSQTGVYVGICNSDYFRMLFADPLKIDVYAGTGGTASVATGRLSYVLGLHGPNLAIDTACSSSLVALHLACRDLRRGECAQALVGGVNLILTPEVSINFSKAQMMASDGRCKTFDARADGYVRGEGCAVLVLKRLSDALANRDNILALVRGTAVNHDGHSGGLTAPNGLAQEAVIRAALADAHAKAEQVGYVEAHGTGTALGDPIEVRALGAALCQGREPGKPLFIGSVKTNIGHLEATSGLAGLIKVVLALQHQEIPAHLHFQQPSPYIAWDDLPIAVPTQPTPWPAYGTRRIAGVSSFGLSGTNAHAILEEAPALVAPALVPVPASGERPMHVLSLSAKSEKALSTLSERMAQHLDAHPAEPFADVCFSANSGRSHFGHRLAVVAESSRQAHEKLSAFIAGASPNGVFSGHELDAHQPRVAFLFTGHGSPYVGMGRQLYETQPTFRHAIETCDRLSRPYLDQSLISVLYPDQDSQSARSKLDEMAYAQATLFAVEYALATLWSSWGIKPAAVTGHSLGEYAAACIAGVFSVSDGLKMAITRGLLMQSLPDDGEMVTVFAGEATVAPAVAPYSAEVSIAAINSPETVVISGRRAAIDQIVATLKSMKIKTRALPISRAAHSPLVEPLLERFGQAAAAVSYSVPQVAYVSGMSGRLAPAEDVGQANYWRRHLREPVRFAQAMQTLHEEGYDAFVEIGPNPTLLSLGQRCIPAQSGTWLPSLREGWSDWTQMLESLATLYTHGVSVDWVGFERDDAHTRQRIALPTYPWDHRSYWLDRETRPRPPARLAEPRRWDSLLAAGHRQAQQAPLELALQTYPSKWDCLTRLSAAYITCALRELKIFSRAGESHSVESLLTESGIATTYRHLLTRWMRRLAAQGLLQEQKGGAFASTQPLPEPALETLRAEAKATLADTHALLEYVDHCGSHLVPILTGRESPLDTLFPAGSFKRAEALYQEWAVARYLNGIVGAIAESAVRAASGEQPVRILEVGAGTGATTASLLSVLPAEQVSYTFTDVSDLFLERARNKFNAYPFMRYSLLDIEQDSQVQGYSPHSFDVVVAANVLHATRDLAGTLTNIQSLLVPGGVLVLYEATRDFPWYDVTTGLIEGWQRFDDASRRDQPLLSPAQWQVALQEAGFGSVAVFPEPGSVAEILGQHVFAAQLQLAVWEGEREHEPAAGAPAFRSQPAKPDVYGVTHVAKHIAAPSGTNTEFLNKLHEALPSEREDMLADYVRQHITRILRLGPADSLDRNSRLMDLGIDSLMAVELRNLLGTGLALQQPLPATLIFDYPTIQAIATYLAHDVLAFAPPEHVEVSPTQPKNNEHVDTLTSAAQLEQLSDDEVATLLMKRLASHEK